MGFGSDQSESARPENEDLLQKQETENIEQKNPNSIGELLNVSKDLLTFPDKVYRSVSGRAAIDDLQESGVVRNKQSAGLVDKSRWDERVFWSKGGEGKYHIISKDGYVIEAPLSVAEARAVTKEDVTAIYTKNENGDIFDILEQERQKREQEANLRAINRKAEDEQKIQEIRRDLGIGEKP